MSYISVDKAATLKGVSKERIRTLCRQGKLKADRIGRAWLVRRDSLEMYVPRAK